MICWAHFVQTLMNHKQLESTPKIENSFPTTSVTIVGTGPSSDPGSSAYTRPFRHGDLVESIEHHLALQEQYLPPTISLVPDVAQAHARRADDAAMATFISLRMFS